MWGQEKEGMGMTFEEVMAYLKEHGSEAVRSVYRSQGAMEPLFGVNLTDMKPLVKRIGKDHELALRLYDTCNSDAMYLAGLIADPERITMEELDDWVGKAYWEMLSERCVAVIAAKSPHGFEAARKWVQSRDEMTASAGYAVFSTLFSVVPDEEIDLEEVRRMIDDIVVRIQEEKTHLQNAMKNFMIMAGIFIKPLYEDTLEAANRIGTVKPSIPENDCNIQSVTDYLVRYKEKGEIGVKVKNLSP